MKTTQKSNEIPKTGRIGRFAKILVTKTGSKSFEKIMQNSIEYGSYKPVKKAEWWNNTVKKMENEIGKEKAVEVELIQSIINGGGFCEFEIKINS